MLPASAQPSLSLPELRQDLVIEPGARGIGGELTWLIIDSAQHRYIQIDETAYQLLSIWQAGETAAAFANRVSIEFNHLVTEDDVKQLVRFIGGHCLTVEPVDGGWKHYADQSAKSDHGWLMWMIHNYLYIKLPLVRPEATLRKFLPWVEPLYSRGFAIAIAMTGLSGLYLVSRHWSEFWGTFQYTFTWQGGLAFALALIFVKSAHELGHAFTALRFGCRVPAMGVCFLVMFPVLYTDVTDAWRIQDRRKRLMIGAAGVAVELGLACIATLLWVFLPDGIAKSVAFSIASAGWIISLAINLNPLMRFDGYYLFSDWTGVDNLQARAFEFGRWRLRELLFAPGLPPPERVAQKTERTLFLFAWTIWIYRLVLFTGIAILVYHMAFKVLGIVLFLVEIIYFIVWPIASEAADWWAARKSLAITRRSKFTGALICGAILVAFIPWSTRITLPAVLEASSLARVYPQRPGMVETVHVKPGNIVLAGDVLVEMRSSEAEHRLAVVNKKIRLTKMRLARRSSDDEDRSRSLILEKEFQSLESERQGLVAELAEYRIIAPSAGTVVEFNGEVHAGRAISRSEVVALIRGDEPAAVRGYVAEENLKRIPKGAQGSFLADAPDSSRISVTLNDIATSGSPSIEMPELASVYGGSIAVRPHVGAGNERRMAPVGAQYLTTLNTNTAVVPNHSLRGIVQLDGVAESFASRAWRQVAGVLIRESGF